MDTVLTLACSLWFKVRILTLSSLLLVRSCLRDDHDMGAQLVPVLVVLLLLLLVLQVLLQSSCAPKLLDWLILRWQHHASDVLHSKFSYYYNLKYVRPRTA